MPSATALHSLIGDLSPPQPGDAELAHSAMETAEGPSIFYVKNIAVEIVAPDDFEREQSSTVVLTIHDPKFHSAGRIEIDRVSGAGASYLLEPFFEASTHDSRSSIVPPEVLDEVLHRAEVVDAAISSSLGDHPEEIVTEYRKLISPGPLQKPRYRFVDLLEGRTVPTREDEYGSIRTRKSGAMRWIDIEAPRRRLLESIAEDLELSNGTVGMCLQDQQPVTANGLKETLYISTKELSFDPVTAKLKLTPLIIVIGKNFLVTMHPEQSAAVNRVWSEIKRDEVAPSDLEHTNHLACRIFGSSLYAAKEAIDAITKGSEGLNGRHWQPTREDLERAERLSNSSRQAESVMLHLEEIVEALREKRHLFGAPGSKESLGRYSAIIRSSLDQTRMNEERIADKRQSWGIEAQNISNKYTSRLSIAIAALSVPAAIFGFFGQSYSTIPFTNFQIWTGNVVAAAASCALLGGLWYLTHREKLRPR